jgi:hypothetical protein
MEQRFFFFFLGYNEKTSIKQLVSVVLVAIVFLASFMVIIQPAYLPPVNDMEGIFELSPKNAHILFTKEGKYELYADDMFIFELEEYSLNIEPFKELSVIIED